MKPLSILVVDEDAPFRSAVTRVLRAAGHLVDEASGAAQALCILRARCPDVLVTDIMMPKGDGIELITDVRAAHGGDPGSPVMTDYEPPFAFTGTVKKALVDVSGELVEDQEAKFKMYMARQ